VGYGAPVGGLDGVVLAQGHEEGRLPTRRTSRAWSTGATVVRADMDDRRLSGQGLAPIRGPLAPMRSFADRGSLSIENAEGAWDGIGSIADRPGVYGVWLVGEEAYEGFTALLYAISSITVR